MAQNQTPDLTRLSDEELAKALYRGPLSPLEREQRRRNWADADAKIERAYRRGCHQALFLALKECKELQTREEVLQFLSGLTAVVKEYRYDRKAHGSLLDEAIQEAQSARKRSK